MPLPFVRLSGCLMLICTLLASASLLSFRNTSRFLVSYSSPQDGSGSHCQPNAAATTTTTSSPESSASETAIRIPRGTTVPLAPSARRERIDHENNQNAAPVRFVFVAGLEGTGHNLSGTLIKNGNKNNKPGGRAASPVFRRLQELELVETVQNLEKALHQKVWVAHCRGRAQDLTSGYQETVRLMQQIHGRFAQDREKTLAEGKEYHTGTIFLGVMDIKVSYPFGFDGCRPLRYPNLDIFDEACQQAGVLCEMALLYRDPYAIVHSNQRRKFDKHLPKAIHLYTSMNLILQMQLARFANRTAGCWGLFETDDGSSTESFGRALGFFNQNVRNNNNTDNENSHPNDWDAYRSLVMRHKPPMSEEQKRELIPPNYQLYMDSLLRTHQDVLEQCQRQEKASHHQVIMTTEQEQ